jgi:hypothetical protein
LYFTNQITGLAAIILGIAAVVLAATALVSFCPIYFALHLSSKKQDEKQS